MSKEKMLAVMERVEGIRETMWDSETETEAALVILNEWGDLMKKIFVLSLLLMLALALVACDAPQEASEEASEEKDMRAELERLRRENEALKQKNERGASLKVSAKGAVSLYGLGRFPVTLYKEQWTRVLDMADEIRAFIVEHDGELKTK